MAEGGGGEEEEGRGRSRVRGGGALLEGQKAGQRFCVGGLARHKTRSPEIFEAWPGWVFPGQVAGTTTIHKQPVEVIMVFHFIIYSKPK